MNCDNIKYSGIKLGYYEISFQFFEKQNLGNKFVICQ